MQNGKGDKPRPMSVPRTEYEKNWELIFGTSGGKGDPDKDEIEKPKGSTAQTPPQNK